MFWLDEMRAAALGVGVGVAISHPVGRKVLKKTAVRSAVSLYAGANLIRIGSASRSIGLGQAAVGVAGGYFLGAVVGTAVVYAWHGESSAQDVVRFYAHPVQSTFDLIAKF